jgi:hypothetical protein
MKFLDARILLLFVFAFSVSMNHSVVAQKRPVRRPAQRTANRPAPVDYSRFSHVTKKHQATCNSCHKVPTSNWRKVSDYPDVADYPGHGACVSCHRSQFFKGAKPVICSVCHSKVSPKDDARFAFRKPAGPRQFLIEFPHDKHQDVIAKLFRGLPGESQIVQASYSIYADDKTKHYNNCEICHGPKSTPAVAPAGGWIDGFVPDNFALKSVPASHASCFSCHWKSEQPVNDNCVGCHKLPVPPATVSVDDGPKRKSMKFRHGRPEAHVAECSTCHINITKSATLKGLKPDVPITQCTQCHNKDGQRLDLSKELTAIDKDRAFVCVYCHTSDIGRRDPPAGHYLIAERPPLKRQDIK